MHAILGGPQRRERQRDDECGALIFAAALDADRATVEFDELFYDRQAESEAAVRTGRRGIDLAEAFEDDWQVFRRDADPVVVDGDFEMRIDAGEDHVDLAAFGGELDRIGKQVPNDLLQ